MYATDCGILESTWPDMRLVQTTVSVCGTGLSHIHLNKC